MSDKQQGYTLNQYQEDAERTGKGGRPTTFGADQSRLLRACLGLYGEGGEFADLVKKWLFHGHPLTPQVVEKMKKELGDKLWYIVDACAAMGWDLEEIAIMNRDKLRARYPDGFTSEASINRKPEDLNTHADGTKGDAYSMIPPQTIRLGLPTDKALRAYQERIAKLPPLPGMEQAHAETKARLEQQKSAATCQCPPMPWANLGSMASGSGMEREWVKKWEAEHGTHHNAQARREGKELPSDNGQIPPSPFSILGIQETSDTAPLDPALLVRGESVTRIYREDVKTGGDAVRFVHQEIRQQASVFTEAEEQRQRPLSEDESITEAKGEGFYPEQDVQPEKGRVLIDDEDDDGNLP